MEQDAPRLTTEILSVRASVIQGIPLATSQKSQASRSGHTFAELEDWTLTLDESTLDAQNLRRAADELRTTDVPVAFPTETVYGLGADATRSSAVKGIYRAKQRPSDNPLIVHVHSLRQLRHLLRPQGTTSSHDGEGMMNGISSSQDDPIPSIYHPLIRAFWPGPLTIILPNPSTSNLAPEVTAHLPTFGARMPSNPLALAFLKLADVPVAAPSANSSSKPSPTTAAHVAHDLDGRITTIIDGGPCDVGLESTVVSGLCQPPVILRPGGVGIDELRACEGWEDVVVGYKDGRGAEGDSEERPLAPGMKYRHYSPKARVLLYEAGTGGPRSEELSGRVGIMRTARWVSMQPHVAAREEIRHVAEKVDGPVVARAIQYTLPPEDAQSEVEVWEVDLGASPKQVARGLFSALRELDLLGVDVIFVEGIDDQGGEEAAAVMNRLRKAAEVR